MAKKKTIEELMALANDYGVSENPIVRELVDKYGEQKDLISKVAKDIKRLGLTCTKEYVKGRENLVHNPLLDVYQKHQDSLSRTLDSLTDAIIKFGTTPSRKGAKMSALDDDE